MEAGYDESYINDILRELFDELHEIRVNQCIEEEKKSFLKTNNDVKKRIENYEAKRPFLVNYTEECIKLVEDYIPKIFTTYDESKNNNILLKDMIRQHLDMVEDFSLTFLLFRTNKNVYSYAPKLGNKKSQQSNIENFQKKIEAIINLMGGGYYSLSDEASVLMIELEKALKSSESYISPEKIRKPTNTYILKRWFLNITLPKQQYLIDQYLKKLSNLT